MPCKAGRRPRLGLVGRLVVGRLLAAVGLAVVVGVGGGGCAVKDRQVIAQADEAHGELSKAVVTDPQLAPYIQQVGDRIILAAEEKYKAGLKPKGKSNEDRSWMFSTKTMQFHFVNSQTLNAFTTGGEHMYVYTELLRQCKNEHELAAVMAHEYAHVFGRHVQNGMSRQMWAQVGAVGAAGAGYLAGGQAKGADYAQYAGGAAGALAGLATAGFTRKDETEADELGFQFYVAAGWDPDQFAGFFRTLLEVEKQAGRSSGGLAEFTSDHPSTAKRVEAAEKWAAAYKAKTPDWQSRITRPVADAAQFRQVQARSVAIADQVPSDKTLSTQKLAMALPRSCLWPDEPHPVSARRAQESLKQDLQRQEPAPAAGGTGR